MVPVLFCSQHHKRPEQPLPPALWSCSVPGLETGLICCLGKVSFGFDGSLWKAEEASAAGQTTFDGLTR